MPVVQTDRSPKRYFVLGVYASAVHACWRIGNDHHPRIRAVAVASEPHIFWDGDNDQAREIISKIKFKIPALAGCLEPASSQLNGPSGRALDERFLHPLGVKRSDVWLCDLELVRK